MPKKKKMSDGDSEINLKWKICIYSHQRFFIYINSESERSWVSERNSESHCNHEIPLGKNISQSHQRGHSFLSICQKCSVMNFISNFRLITRPLKIAMKSVCKLQNISISFLNFHYARYWINDLMMGQSEMPNIKLMTGDKT